MSILTHEQIAALEKFVAPGAKVMSVYLNVPAERRLNQALQTAFTNLVQSLPVHVAAAAADDIERILSTLAQPGGSGFVAFSCAAESFWHAQYLPVPVADHIVVERKPDVGPLISLLDEHERYAVALVDKARARLFTIRLGAIEERHEMYEDLPTRHDQGGLAQSRFQRHHEEHVRWHLKDVADRLERMAREHPFDRLFLAGPVEPVSELRDLLPRALADRLVEVTHLDVTAGEDEVLAKTRDIERRAEREQEARVVNQLAEADAHQRGAWGFVGTLRALYLGNVQTLVVADGVQWRGVECVACGLLERIPLATCPVCGDRMEPIHDVVHRAMARAIGQGGDVEVVHDEAAQRLAGHEGLGAIFRFTNPLAEGATSSAPPASR